MKIVHVGKILQIFDDDLRVHENGLPVGVYKIRCSQERGFFFEESDELEVKESKIYGIHNAKVKKALDVFEDFERNLGIILSGDKGIGKSLFSRMLCMEGTKRGYPVVIVDQFIPGISQFIEALKQEVILLFDEFDKTFSIPRGGIHGEDEKQNPQVSLLSLLDGTGMGKKLFVVTCNDISGMNEYMINRPGRFHYHFRFDYPEMGEIEVYLKDKLSEQYWTEIPKVLNFAGKIRLNYDCLKAICYELARGENFELAILDLNIINVRAEVYDISVRLNNGQIFRRNHYRLDLFDSSGGTERLWVESTDGCHDKMMLTVDLSKSTYSYTDGCTIVPGACVELDLEDLEDMEDDYRDKVVSAHKVGVEVMRISRYKEKGVHYAVNQY